MAAQTEPPTAPETVERAVQGPAGELLRAPTDHVNEAESIPLHDERKHNRPSDAARYSAALPDDLGEPIAFQAHDEDVQSEVGFSLVGGGEAEGPPVGQAGLQAYRTELPATTAAARSIDDETAQIITVLTDRSAPESFVYDFDLPEGASLEEAEGDVVNILRDGSVIGLVLPPWAVDAAGEEVDTEFEVRDGQLVQHVRHRQSDVTYPVVADPSVTLGSRVYLWLSFSEANYIFGLSATGLAAYMCAVWGSLHPVMCAVSASGAAALLIAFSDVKSNRQCRYKVAFRYWGWPDYIERLRNTSNGCGYAKKDIPG